MKKREVRSRVNVAVARSHNPSAQRKIVPVVTQEDLIRIARNNNSQVSSVVYKNVGKAERKIIHG